MRRVAVVMVVLVVGWPSLASGAAPGGLYAFGDNSYGQLGNAINSGTNTANPTPRLVVLPVGAGRVTQIAAGASSYVLTATPTANGRPGKSRSVTVKLVK